MRLWVGTGMEFEIEKKFRCPFCNERISMLLDLSEDGDHTYIEDCEVCCRPIALNVHCHYGEIDSVDFDRA